MVDVELIFAKKVFISLVKSPSYKNIDKIIEKRLDKTLKYYFNTTRTFKVDDQFSIKSFDQESKL